MKVFVIGSGGREHAIIWKISQNPKVKKIYCAPGSGAISQIAHCECVSIVPEDTSKLLEFAKAHAIDLTIVGPELPLSKGIVDEFEAHELPIFGPRKNAAVLEFSKSFTKEFCTRHNIPTADYMVFHNSQDAKEFIKKRKNFPLVVKADGLASGKGVIIAKNKEEALEAIEDMMVYEKFGDAGRKVVLEDFLPGREATFMVATDGEDFVVLDSAQDHKRLLDDDQGPNTGGMGVVSPAPILTSALREKVIEKIIKPTLSGMKSEDRLYRGVLYAGLMIVDGEPSLIEFNCRFGDPEAQAILIRLESDLVTLIEACLEGKLKDTPIQFTSKASVCVVMAAGGYPGEFQKGKVIGGLDDAAKISDVVVFHAGTKLEEGKFLTSGGRVLGVTALGVDLKSARKKAYEATALITWEGVHYRTDIGERSLS